MRNDRLRLTKMASISIDRNHRVIPVQSVDRIRSVRTEWRPPLRRSVRLVAGLVSLVAATASAQQVRWNLPGEERYEHVGTATCWVDDLDHDGIRDLAAGCFIEDYVGCSYAESYVVRLVSSRDLSTIGEIVGETNTLGLGDNLGAAITPADDHYGDGIADLWIGAPTAKDGHGAVYLYSTVTHARLLEVTGDATRGSFGATLETIGDVDGDGLPEVAVGDPTSANSDGSYGVIQICSSIDGSILREWRSSRVDGWTPAAIDRGSAATFNAIDDVDGDGVRDLALVDSISDAGDTVKVDLISGVTLETIRSITVGPPPSGYIWGQPAVGPCGDADGDGVGDLVIIVADGDTTIATAAVRSGADGHEITRSNVGYWEVVNIRLESPGDFNGDGFGDFVLADVDPNDPAPQLRVFSGKSGQPLLILNEYNDYWSYDMFSPAEGRPDDLNADGISDIAYGLYRYGSFFDSRIGAHSFTAGEIRRRGGGSLSDEPYLHAFTDDRDGDGIAELICVEGFFTDTHDHDHFDLVTLRGCDGAELVRQSINTLGLQFYSDAGLYAIPDQDGDQQADTVLADGNAKVVLFGSRSNELWRVERSSVGFGRGIAVDPGSASIGARVAVGAPSATPGSGKDGAGDVTIYDLSNGAVVFKVNGATKGENLGSSLAFLGDVNGDGIGDWAAGAPGHPKNGSGSGRVAVISGANGAVLRDLFGAAAGDRFGAGVGALADVDGDGIGELIVGAPGDGVNDDGAVRVYAGSSWTLLVTTRGRGAHDEFGAQCGGLVDLNGDGTPDLHARSSVQRHTDLVSGHNSRRLREVPRASPLDSHLASVPPWIENTLAVNAVPTIAVRDESSCGITVYDLPELFLELTPATVGPGASIALDTRGGPAGSLSGLFLVRVDDVPFEQFIAISALDSFGEWSFSDVVPPDLSGITFTLQSLAIGFDGKLVSSSEELLTIQ